MAEAASDGERLVKPPPKRRRILDPSAIVPVPVYSSKVSSSLQMKPKESLFTQNDVAENPADVEVVRGLVDDAEEKQPEQTATAQRVASCPSPSPPESPVLQQSRKVKRKLSEIDRKLQAVNVLLSPEASGPAFRRLQGAPSEDDGVLLVSRSESPGASGSTVREIPLKIRCRTDVHKIPVLSSMSLSVAVAKLSVILKVPPPRLLLLMNDVELPTHATVQELGLGIADIIECVVMTTEDKDGAGGNNISVKLQSNDKNLSHHFSLHRDEPFGSVFARFLSQLPDRAQKKVCFYFDGCKVTAQQSPAQLNMEDGDIIEVWT